MWTRGKAKGKRAQLEALSATMTDEAAAVVPMWAEAWKKGTNEAPIHYAADGKRWRDPFDGHLYRVRSGMDHDAPNDDNYAPSRAHSLWEAVAEPGEDGSREHPVSYHLGMQLTVGLYYKDADVVEDDVLYYCKRTEQDYAFQHHLADLVSSGYVEVVTA